jgi:hypothetical protein
MLFRRRLDRFFSQEPQLIGGEGGDGVGVALLVHELDFKVSVIVDLDDSPNLSAAQTLLRHITSRLPRRAIEWAAAHQPRVM